jgi:hypothetical protein
MDDGMEVDFPETQAERWLKAHVPSPAITAPMLAAAVRSLPLPAYILPQIAEPLQQYVALCQRNEIAQATQLRDALLRALGL